MQAEHARLPNVRQTAELGKQVTGICQAECGRGRKGWEGKSSRNMHRSLPEFLSCACIYLKGNSRMCKTVGTERSVVALVHRFRESWKRNGRGIWGMMEILHTLTELVITWM